MNQTRNRRCVSQVQQKIVRRKNPISRLMVLVFTALILPMQVSVAADANAAKGIVVEHCVACHEVPGYLSKAESAQLDAPSFRVIANNTQTYDPQKLRLWLRQPHWPMQQFILSERDVDNLLAFIESLRSQ
jgi:mono/diheme cytochrome c family protein